MTRHPWIRRRRPERPARARGDDGLTILELVIAMGVFAIVILGVASLVDSGLGLARSNRHRSVAANLAAQEMDELRSLDFVSVTPGLATSTETVEGVPYTVTRDISWVAASTTTSLCDFSGGGATPQLLRAQVLVSWPNMAGVRPVRSDTVLTPPVGAYSDNTGHIAVRVRDRDANPASGQPVRVSGGSTNTVIVTGSDGCAFFAFLAPGAYTVTLDTAGYVDPQGVAAPSQSAAVIAGETVSRAFDYDRAATLDLTITAPDGGSFPNNLNVTLGNTAFTPSGTKTFTGTGATRSISVFPASSGYTAWAGHCADADPEGQKPGNTGPYWPDGERPDTVETPPGATAAATVPLRTLQITLQRSTGVPLDGVSMRAVHPSMNGCTGGVTYTIGTTSGGGQLTVALPYGTWTIRPAGGYSPFGSWPDVAVSPTESGVISVTVVTT